MPQSCIIVYTWHLEDVMKRIIGLVILMLVVSGCGGTTNNGNEKPTDTYTPIPLTATYTEVPTSTFTPEPTNTPTITPTPTLGIGSTHISPKDGMVMVYVPEGEFKMGFEGGAEHEGPEHFVYLDAYWVDRTEVTNSMFLQFLNEIGNQSEAGVEWLDAQNKYVQIYNVGDEWLVVNGYELHPVIEVNWYGARAYCDWAGRKLPTEAMWEKAARGADGRTYPWGERIDCGLAQYGDCGGGTVPVGSYPNGASPYGTLDMTGNVNEWVADLYDIYYYSNSPYENPQGPSIGYYVVPWKSPLKDYHVLRGGAYGSVGWGLQAAARGGASPEGSYPGVGFRCGFSA